MSFDSHLGSRRQTLNKAKFPFGLPTSVGNPPFFRDLDLELELLCSKSGIEIWNTEWNNVPTGLDFGLGIHLLDAVDCGIGI